MSGKARLAIVIGCAGLVGASLIGLSSGTAGSAARSNAELSLLEVTGERIVVEFDPPGRRSGLLEAELYDLGGTMLAKVMRRHSGTPVKVELYAQINKNDLAGYYLRYRFDSNEEFRKRSLLFVGEVLETVVLGQREFVAGTRPVIRILVRDRAAGVPIEGAAVEVELLRDGTVLAKVTAASNEKGEVAAALDMPEEPAQNLKLRINVATKTSKDTVEETLQVRSALRTLLTTDKPLYQPGQTIHIRTLTLAEPKMEPLSASEVVFEVEDAKGNKVFKNRQKTDEYGISHVDFVLADELNMGTYCVRAIVAGAKEEKTVTVDRYVLPKFKVQFKSERDFYQPGETIKGEVQADYFFGKPVAGGKVQIKCSKFDVEYVDFQSIEGKTDDSGHYKFEATLPQQFVGQPLEAGRALAKFEISIIDTADHKETITKNVPVTGSPIVIAAVPESGELVPGLENKIYLVATYADSTPAACKVTWENPPTGNQVTVQTDEGGFAEVALTPKQGETVQMTLAARDAKGQTGRATVALRPKDSAGDDSLLVRTDRSLYRVGQKAQVSVVSTRRSGAVYVDVIKDRQTYLTQTLDLKDGKAQTSLAFDAVLAGTVQINAYVIGKNGVIVRDRRLALVDPADDLKVTVTGDSESYLPGKQATLRVQVNDKTGRGAASALGVIVVDEAVFALQEMQPGLEKVYFYLEKEMATPRYEIHGYDLQQSFVPGPAPRPIPIRRAEDLHDSAARVLLASARGVGDYSLHVDTYERDNKGEAFQAKMIEVMMGRYQTISRAMSQFSIKHRQADQQRYATGIDLDVLVREGSLEKKDTLDPWGVPMRLSGQWNESAQRYMRPTLSSAGIDGQWDTADDVTMPPASPGRDRALMLGARGGGGMGGGRGAVMFDAADGMVLRQAMAAPQAMEKKDVSGAAEPVRIRQYFPETLYFNPAVITDGRGRASLEIPLADSITTWRLSCIASSRSGQLGSTTAGIRVFQDFFVDIDFPVALTQNDEVHVPVAIYNYLQTEQSIRLTVEREDWFELKELGEKTVTLAASEVRSVYFPIVARKVGFHKFTVTARGTKMSDAVARPVEIVPDGKEHLVSQNGRLQGTITHTITIPENAIDDASKIFVKVYPGVLSQVVEGLDGMLRMPFGCFEQTSSVTYPNVLVMDYMKTTGKITPELQMKAEGFINAGYQRLVSFEVPGGGFEWFGKAPAHRILTAYGLMEFYDMSRVYDVDPAVISRTQQWLTKGQDADGSWKPSEGGIREGAINRFTDDVLRTTAYITWALASSQYKGLELAKGVDYVKKHTDEIKDTYTLALAANALGTVEPDGQATRAVLQKLLDQRKEEGDLASWQSQSETPTHGSGEAADIEVTALAVQAFLRCGQELGTVTKAITHLVKHKDAFGTWQSTQATIQSLRAMLMAERGATLRADATVAVKCGGRTITTLRIDENNSDVMQLVDLKDQTHKGNNVVELEFSGKGALLYQLVGRYYLPYPPKPQIVGQEPMTIKVTYDRTELATNDIIGVTATVKNNRPATARMVIVDLGLPPGFTLMPENLEKLIENKTIEKYSVTGRQIIIYLREVPPDKPVEIKYQLLAKYPLKAKTPKAVTYEYYDPDVRAEAAPVELVVAQ